MSSDNLGRLIAAERNALAALNWSREARDILRDLAARLSRVEAENVQLRSELQALRSQVFAQRGSGPTA